MPLAGCDSNTPAQTQEQVKSFEGGPMPPEMQEKLKQIQSKPKETAPK